jgi:type I restriction enzyme R subunit
MQQGLDYAATLDIPFVFSSNGGGFVFHDSTGQSATIETNLGLDALLAEVLAPLDAREMEAAE